MSDEKPGRSTGQVDVSAGLSARAPDLVCSSLVRTGEMKKACGVWATRQALISHLGLKGGPPGAHRPGGGYTNHSTDRTHSTALLQAARAAKEGDRSRSGLMAGAPGEGDRKNKTRWLAAYRVSLCSNSGGRASGWNALGKQLCVRIRAQRIHREGAGGRCVKRGLRVQKLLHGGEMITAWCVCGNGGVAWVLQSRPSRAHVGLASLPRSAA